MFSICKFSVIVLWLASSAAAADTARWEPGKVVAVEQVSKPAKTPDADCRTLPRGQTLPARCRTANLRAEEFWRVTVDVGNKRYVVRPYRAPKLLDSLNQEGPIYVDPKLTAGSAVEVAVYANKSVRLRTEKGDGLPAIVDSVVDSVVDSAVGAVVEFKKDETPNPAIAVTAQVRPSPRAVATAPVSPATSKVVLLENGDFIDLEVQELMSQDIGDGAALYSFPGDSSPTRINSNRPVFLVMGLERGNLELARLQVGKGTRQLLYSVAKKHSASPLAVTATQVSDTLRRVTVNDPLAPGEYALVLEHSNRAFLFEAPAR